MEITCASAPSMIFLAFEPHKSLSIEASFYEIEVCCSLRGHSASLILLARQTRTHPFVFPQREKTPMHVKNSNPLSYMYSSQ